MKTSQYLLATLKETPNDAEIISHQLMLRAGLIRKLTSGNYTWLPLGFRILNKVIRIVREEMDNSGALEILMPSVQPAELWQESGRFQAYGPELLRFKDRHDRDFCYGPTHEEVITDLARRELHSYKQLPINLYQIQTKFRDEIRPRFGVMRAREFIMKDAYSFHLTEESLKEAYQCMYDTYTRIFQRLGLTFRAVMADTGSIGGNASHEFQVLAANGEDLLAISDTSNYAANIELAEAIPDQSKRSAPQESLQKVHTPNAPTIEAACHALSIPLTQSLKAVLVKGKESPVVALFVRGDHEVNPVKAEKLEAVFSPFTFADEKDIISLIGCKPGYIGPCGLNLPVIIDRSAALLSDFSCGANEESYHLTGVNWIRDVAEPHVADIRKVVEGDKSPDGQGNLTLIRGIEVGHIFQLGTKYSSALKATVLNEQGQTQVVTMGCYGLGISRVVAATIEQYHDELGILWPDAIAPFEVVIIPINHHKSHRVREAADRLHDQLIALGIDVLLDDRKETPGCKFSDMDLIGIPHRLVLSERGLDANTIEYKSRKSDNSEVVSLDEIGKFLQGVIKPKNGG